jgi:hypothetical protein
VVATTRQFLIETLRALCVLGLLFLNFGHAPALSAGSAVSVGHGVVVAAADFCGDPADPDAGHAPCHACRATPATLPKPPACAVTLPVVVDVVAAVSTPATNTGFHPVPAARGPPDLA